jgi:hypothetical protein
MFLGTDMSVVISAYVAAAALYLDIYILRPPNHPQLRLANSQVSWLGGGGSESGPTAGEPLSE